jgi:carbon storage regulator
MLVVSRKPGQEIVVPHLGITFTILEVRGEHVRVGIQAPNHVEIHRREVWQRILKQRLAAEPELCGVGRER